MRALNWIGLMAVVASAHWSDGVLLEGRHQIAGDNVIFGWNAFKIQAEFTGTRIGVHMVDAYHDYNVWIDGEPRYYADTGFRHLRPGSRKLVWLDTNLAAGHHTLTLQRRDEGGRAQFSGFELDSGESILPITAQKSRRLEVFGDSFAASYGLESPSRTCTPQQLRDYSNSSLSYPVLLAQKQNAELHLQAISGRGVVRSYGGAELPSMSDLAPKLFPDPESPVYAAKDWPAGLVVIGLGTNDYSTNLVAGEKWTSAWELKAAFKNRYHQLLDSLRLNYGGIPFVVMQQSNYSALSQVLQEITDEQRAAGYQNVHYIAFKALETTACQWHASVKDHELMASSMSHLADSLDLWNVSADVYKGAAVDVKLNSLSQLRWEGDDLILPSEGKWDLSLRDVAGHLLDQQKSLSQRAAIPAALRRAGVFAYLSHGEQHYFGPIPLKQ